MATMKKEWANHEYNYALLKIKSWLNSRRFETRDGVLGHVCVRDMDKILGLPYTSSGRAAGLFITNTILWLDKEHKYNVYGFEMDEDDTVYAVCHDVNENELLIPINK